MRAFILLAFTIFSITSFKQTTNSTVSYQLELEAKGCHYQITVNGKVLEESKSYQQVNKKFNLEKELTEEGEQRINVNMLRISRDMPLNLTKGYVILKLEKKENDSISLIKELRLPTFPYDEDEKQPQSISGSIYFDKILKKEESNEKEEDDEVEEKPKSRS